MKKIILILTLILCLTGYSAYKWDAVGLFSDNSIDQTLLSTEVTFSLKRLAVETGIITQTIEVANGASTAEITLDGSGNVCFEDAVTSIKTLADLAAGGGSGTGTVETLEVYTNFAGTTKESIFVNDDVALFNNKGLFVGNSELNTGYFADTSISSWGRITSQSTNLSYVDMATSSNGQYLLRVGIGTYRGCFRSENYGDTWTTVASSSGLTCSCPWMSSDGKFQGFFYTYYYKWYTSNDYGQTFSEKTLLNGYATRHAACSGDGKFIISSATSNHKPMYSFDYGETFQQLTTFPATNRTLCSVCCSNDGKNIYFCDTNGPRFYYSYDRGKTWAYKTNYIPSSSTLVLVCSDDGKVIYGASGYFLCRSVDYGQTWAYIQILSNTSNITGLSCTSDGKTVLVSQAGQATMYYSTDYGASWVDTNIASDTYDSCFLIKGTGSFYVNDFDGFLYKGYLPIAVSESFSTSTNAAINSTLSTNDSVTYKNGNLIFNQNKLDKNTRFESDHNANILCIDGGVDAVGIGVAIPQTDCKLQVSGDIYPHTDDSYYLGKNDDDSPHSWKGIILKDTANGKYYRLEVISGTFTATDLTD